MPMEMKPSDTRTSMVAGKYSDSGLGRKANVVGLKR